MESYNSLLQKTKDIILLDTVYGTLNWDQLTTMPHRGHQQRASQLAYLSRIVHRMRTDSEINQILTTLEMSAHKLEPFQNREVQLARRRFDREYRIPENLISEYTEQISIATDSWKESKAKQSWEIFEPELEKLLNMAIRIGEFCMEPLGVDTPYDYFMDTYEPQMTVSRVATLFKELRKHLIRLVRRYGEVCRDIRVDFMKRQVPLSIQQVLITDITNYVGYDTISKNAGGRIDEAEHPFSSGYYDDYRIATHYFEDDVFNAVLSGLHEAGHAIHGQNLNPDWKWMYLGEKCSAGFSESQSRFLENIIGRSSEFWEYYYDRFRELTGGIFQDVSARETARALNKVEPSRIRVMADEATYLLHIIIRFEIESDLFSGKVSVAEIPRIWNEKYDRYLGVDIRNDAEGALQDTHWAWGLWGYFPSYALGDLYGGMIAGKLTHDISDWRSRLSEGDIMTTIRWLIDHVHKKSNSHYPLEMIEKITGRKLAVNPFVDYLKDKYKQIYD